MSFNIFKRYRIGHLFFFSFAGFIGLVFWIVISVSYWFSVHDKVNSAIEYQQSMLHEMNMRLAAQLNSVEVLSLAISRDNQMLDFLKNDTSDPYTRFKQTEEMRIRLSNFTFSMPILHSVFLYMDNPPTNNYQDPVQFYPLSDLDNSVFAPQSHADFFWVGHHTVTKGELNQAVVISFARKIYNSADKFKALLVLNVKAADIQKQMEIGNGAKIGRAHV